VLQQVRLTPMATDHLLHRWLACQRPRHHVLVRCRPGGFASIAAEVMTLGAPPVRLCPLPGPLHLPPDKTGTLILNDVAALTLRNQIALYDWLTVGTGTLRVISITAAPLATLVESGIFLEGLFHRLGAVQFDLSSREFAW
jgi:sigma-54-interacting transcriptional regulator